MKAHEIQKKILQVISESREILDTYEIAEKLQSNSQEVEDHLSVLQDEGLVELRPRMGQGDIAWLTARGRIALRDPNYMPQKAPSQVVNILNVIDSQIQNLAQTGGNSVIRQAFESDLNEKIVELIDQMVELVRSCSQIDPDIRQDYEFEALGLKNELKKSRLNLSRIREMLSFLGDVEGTLGLTVRLTPYFLALSPLIEKIIR